MKRWTILIYGLVGYASFLASSLYLAGWLGNLGVPRSIDAAAAQSPFSALAIDTFLVLLFGVQHSVMARPSFKRRWIQLIPEAAERSTYVLCTSATLAILFWQWRPLGGEIWRVEHPVGIAIAHAMFVAGWLTVVATTFMIHHFDLFGLRQVWLNFCGKPYTALPFRTPGLYRYMRHPLYVGWIIAFWATPTMTISHLFFAVTMTAYILVAIPMEERNLLDHFGDHYREYCARVGRLLPRRVASQRNVASMPQVGTSPCEVTPPEWS